MVKTSCYYYNDRKCEALTVLLCRTKKCNFYKTKEQHDEDMKKYPVIDYGYFQETKIRIERNSEDKNGTGK